MSAHYYPAQGGGGSDYWGDAVANVAALPAAGAVVGEVRLVLDTDELYEWNGTTWQKVPATGVVGPASATDNAVARFDGTTGKLIQNSGVIVSDANNVSGIADLAVTGTTTLATSLTGPLKAASGVVSASAVNLTSEVTGTLPVANGGTNSAASLNNNRNIVSSGGAIVESAAITASRALVSDANGLPTHSSVTTTELGYVSGVTSAIQTQLDTKAIGVASAVDSEVALFSSTGGKQLKRATGTGVAHLTSGVLSASNVVLTSEVTGTLPIANGGTNNTSFTSGRMNYFDGTSVSSAAAVSYGTTTQNVLITPTATTLIPLALKMNASQTAFSFQIQDSSNIPYIWATGKRTMDTNTESAFTVNAQSAFGASAQTYALSVTNTHVSGGLASGTLTGFTSTATCNSATNAPNLSVSNQAVCNLTAAATVTTTHIFRAQAAVTNSGVMTNLVGLSVQTPFTNTGGTVVNAYGVKVEDQTTGTTLNYAIFTGRGLVNIGDQTTITCPTSTTKGLIVKAAASQSVNLQEWQNSSGTALRSMDQNGKLVTIVSVSGNVTLTAEGIHLVDTSSARSLTLPTPVAGTQIVVKDATGSCATNNITIVRSGSEQIETVAASYVLNTDLGSWTFVTNGTNWFII